MDNLETIFNNLKGSFDKEEPAIGHEARFLKKLNKRSERSRRSWGQGIWKPLLMAASIALLIAIGFGYFIEKPTTDQQIAKISPEASKTEFYFANLINEQTKLLQSESSPETKQMVEDAMFQLKKLEKDYKKMEQDLLNGGNSKFILSAMVTNFQTRISLLQEVLQQIEQIKVINEKEKTHTLI
ncbi:hypothetical protein SB49_01900 [Sediminicola sp. YIK13]|uniref:hypothetical protein n=1 Tax=Sediminicola sp. YIK13 TaxID=1453352 RepID=UPI00071EF3EB|nr:hypothetical protein [Sediminicola sp. YIK13]ALM06696.1 hypothetical protein SB49_01900 [Sediminicola sp. YIK13]